MTVIAITQRARRMRNDPAVERAEGTALSTGGHIVWRPSRERIERSTLTAYGRWLEQTRGLAFASYAELWQWSVDDLEIVLGIDLGVLRDPGIDALRARARLRRDARSPLVPGRPAQLRRARLPRPGAGRRGDRARVGGPRAGRADVATSSRLRRRASPSALRALGVGPGDRVVAYLPNIAEAVAAFLACASIGATWSSCSPDFGARTVVDRFAQIEPKVLLAVDGYRYGGRPFDRSERAAAAAGGDPVARAHRRARISRTRLPILDGLQAALSWEDLLERGDSRRPGVRAAAVRPSALGALQLRYHGIAEGHRPRPRRHPARALEAPASARRPAAGRPLLLVHDDRLDDVELPRRRPADRCRDRALRRQSSGTRHGRSVGSRRTCAHHLLRHQRRVSRRLPEGGRGACARARPVGAAEHRLDRIAARAGGLRLGLRPARARTSGSSRPRAAPTCAPRSSAACRRCRSTGASCRRARWAAASRPGTRAASR